MIEKSNKPNKYIKFFAAIGGVTCFAAAGCVGTGILKNIITTKLIKENDYQEANAIYRQTQIDIFKNQLATQEITQQQYDSKMKDVKDLSVDYYMTSESVPPQVQKEYTALKKDEKNYKIAGLALSCMVVAEGIAGLATSNIGLKKEEKEVVARYDMD